MNKSLAERIGEHTRTVIAERETEKRAKNKADVISKLAETIKSRASKGESIFSNEATGELDFTIYDFDEMPKYETEIVLKDIGFEIKHYPACTVVILPRENVSREIQELMEMYYKIINDFEDTEKAKAESDCTEVLEKLEKGEYEVEKIDKVIVEFTSSSGSKQYRTHVRERMEAQGFIISISSNQWSITIIREEGD